MTRYRHGLGFGWLIMVLMLVLAALMWALLNQPVEELLLVGDQYANSPDVTTGRERFRTAWDFAPLAFLVTGALYILARAIFESAKVGR
jgi:hypothetical protein